MYYFLYIFYILQHFTFLLEYIMYFMFILDLSKHFKSDKNHFTFQQIGGSEMCN